MSVVENRSQSRVTELLKICVDCIENLEPDRQILLLYPSHASMMLELSDLLNHLSKYPDYCGFKYSKSYATLQWTSGSTIRFMALRTWDLSRIRGLRLKKWYQRIDRFVDYDTALLLDSRVR